MDKIEKSIWMYLDGTLSEEETILYKQRTSTDPKFKQRVDSITSLHTRLSSLPPSPAPDSLLQNVMVGIRKESKVYAKANFEGLKKFLIGVTITMIAIGLYIIFNSSAPAMPSSLDYPMIAEATDWATKGTNMITSLIPSPKSVSIVVGFFALMMVFWMDMLGQNLKLSRRRI